MGRKRIAVPSSNPGGLEGGRSEHFGHCDLFTLIDVENGAVVGVNTVASVAHGAGGCMEPVGMLKDHGVHAILVAGMGARPLQGFAQVGIEVYFAARHAFATVAEVVAGMLEVAPDGAHPGLQGWRQLPRALRSGYFILGAGCLR